MKLILTVFVFTFLIVSCNNKSSESEKSGNSNSETSLVSENVEKFEEFYEKFHLDSAFQLSRIKFPIKGNYSDFDTTSNWTSENWELMKLTIDKVDTLEYRIEFEKKEKKVFEGVYCKDCGFSFECEFELIDNKWFLIYRQDNNF